MAKRCLKHWFKFAFRLFVSPDYEKIAGRVEDTDVTYRWLRELVIVGLESVQESDSGFVGSAAMNLRDRLSFMRHVNLENEKYEQMKFWLKSLSGGREFKNSDNSIHLRIQALKIGLLEGAFVYFDEPQVVGNIFKNYFTELAYSEEVKAAVENKSDADLATQTKAILEATEEYLKAIGVTAECPDAEFKFAADWPPSPPEFTPPAIWVFGSYGLREGQMHYPEKVLVDSEGRFLVLEEDVIGMGGIETVQRVQLFSGGGKFLKSVLTRGMGGVNGMYDMTLDNKGNLLVSDKNADGMGRIQVFDYDGKRQLEITATEVVNPENKNFVYSPRFNCLRVDSDGRILAGDPNSNSVHVYSPDGVLLFRFGKEGKADGEFQQISGISVSKDDKIYVMDGGKEKVQIFDKSGNFVSQFGGDGLDLRSMVIDTKNGEIIGSEYYKHKIKVFNMEGTLLRENGQFGTHLGDLWFPYGLALSKDGKLVVAERENHRVKVYNV